MVEELFSYSFYTKLLESLLNNDYKYSMYHQDQTHAEKSFILRHDIDKSVSKSLDLAQIEADLGVKSTFFVRLHSNFYNPFSYKDYKNIIEIKKLGHEIGLHTEFFDFAEIFQIDLDVSFEKELSIFESILGFKPRVVSPHRTHGSTSVLEVKEGLQQLCDKHNIINSYEDRFFKEMKYISDSSGVWHEGNPINHIGKHDKLHILTHAIWWFRKRMELEDYLL